MTHKLYRKENRWTGWLAVVLFVVAIIFAGSMDYSEAKKQERLNRQAVHYGR